MEPRPQTRAWIDESFPSARLSPLAGDASRRRYFRLTLADGTDRVLMEYTGPFEGETDDMVMNEVFRAAGLPVARILDVAPEAGCLVVEDLGDRMLESALQQAGATSPEALALYERAVELAVEISERGSPALAASPRAAGPALDSERFRFEMDFFLRHFVGDHLGCTAPPDLAALLAELADRAADAPARVLCHRDYHSRNLMVRPDGSLAMVDIQDARWGPATYDLASLLFDAYSDLGPDQVEPLAERYRTALASPPDRAGFHRRLRLVAAQRMLKALGTFGYQTAVLRRGRYTSAIPRTTSRLRELLPSLEETRVLGVRLVDCGGLG
jgi:aminoglycoside/choline kinase family phosphotransferase